MFYNSYCTSSEENVVTCNMSHRSRNVIEIRGGANVVFQVNSSFCSKGGRGWVQITVVLPNASYISTTKYSI